MDDDRAAVAKLYQEGRFYAELLFLSFYNGHWATLPPGLRSAPDPLLPDELRTSVSAMVIVWLCQTCPIMSIKTGELHSGILKKPTNAHRLR